MSALRARPFSLYTPTDPGPTAAVPSADSKSAVVSQPVRSTFEADAERNAIRHQTARWLTAVLGKDFPVERVHQGHVDNYLAYARAYGL